MLVRLTALSHANSEKSLADHRRHPLSVIGVRQSEERREQLGWPKFDLVLHSPLTRAGETARFVANFDDGATRVALPELFYADKDPWGIQMNNAFIEYHNCSLRQFYETIPAAMESWTKNASRAVWSEIRRSNAQDVLIVGHNVLVQGLCSMITGNEGPFLDRVLGECEGYVIETNPGWATLIEVI